MPNYRLNSVIGAGMPHYPHKIIMQYKVIVNRHQNITVHVTTATSRMNAIKSIMNALRVKRKAIINVQKIGA